MRQPKKRKRKQEQPGEARHETEREKKEREALRRRAEWFHRQRAYPGKEIPADPLKRALQQKEKLRVRAGREKLAPPRP